MPDEQRILTGEVLPPLKESQRVATLIGPATFGDGMKVKHVHDVGATVHDLLVQNLAAAYDSRGLVVELVRGSARAVIPATQWHLVRPKAGTQLVVSVVPQGSPKKILRSVLMIAVAMVAIHTGVGLFGIEGGLSGLASATLGQQFAVGLTAAAITYVGSLAINALLPIKPPKLQTDEATTSAGSINNRLQPGAVVPVVLGDMRLYPPHAAMPYTENIGEDRYQVALLTCGYGPVKISDIKIGTIPIEDFEDVTLDIREGWSDDPDIDIYKNELTTDQYGQLLEYDQWQEFTTQANTDEASLDFLFESGLIRVDDKGKRHPRTVAVSVQYRKVGSETWTTLTTYTNTSTGNVTVPYRDYEDWTNPAFGVFGGGATTTTTNGYSFSATSQVPRAFTKKLTFPDRGQYEVRLKRTTAAPAEDGDDTIVDAVKLAIIRSIKYEPPVRGIAAQKRLAFIAIRLRLTDQKAGSIQDLNCRVQRYYPVWNGTAFVDPEATYMASGDLSVHLTRNPAAAFCYVARGPAGKRVIPDSRLHMESISAWWDACDAIDPRTGEERFTYDRVVEQPSTLKAMLQEIAHVGRARLDGPDGRTGVVRDELQTDPKGIFTPRNMRGFKGSFSLGEQVHGARVTFSNEDNHYQEDTVVVYADGWTEETATSFIDLRPVGTTRTAQAHVYGRDQLLVLKHRPEVMEFDASVDAMHNRIGDYVVVHTNQAVPVEIGGDVQEGAAARLKDWTEDAGGNILDVTLDSTIPVKTGVDYSLIIRRPRKASLTVVAEVQDFGAEGETDTFTFKTPLTDTASISEGCLVVLGETNRVARDCIISGIRPGPLGPDGGMEYKIKVLDLAPEIHNSQTEALPVFPIPAGFPQDPVPERVENLTLTETIIYDGGLGRVALTARWQPDNSAVATDHVEIYEVQGADYLYLGQTSATQFDLRHIYTAGETLTIAVVAVSPTGAKRPTYLARRASITITMEADTAGDLGDLIGQVGSGVLHNGWYNFGTKYWDFTSGWDRVLYTRKDGRTVNAMRHRPTDDDTEFGATGQDNYEPGSRLICRPFDTFVGERVNLTVYGDTEDDADGALLVGIAYYDNEGILLGEVIDFADPIEADEGLGAYSRTFTTPSGAYTGRVFSLLLSHTTGEWYVASWEGARKGLAGDDNVQDLGDGPLDPGATDGAVPGVNIYDEDGLVMQKGELRTADGQLVSGRSFDFNNSALGWQGTNLTTTLAARGLQVDMTANEGYITSPDGLGLDGARYDKVIVRIKRTVPGGGDFWDYPMMYYSTAGHGFSSSYRKGASGKFIDNVATTLVFDMADLAAGGDDWVTSTIDALRFRPSFTAGDGFLIDWIAVGRVSAPAADIVAANLADSLGFIDFAATDTDADDVFGGLDLADMGLKVGDPLSTTLEVIALGARRGRLVVRFLDDVGAQIGADITSPYAPAATVYETVKIEGYTIPAGTVRIQPRHHREDGVTGAVGARRLSINKGSASTGWHMPRQDVEESATKGATWGGNIGGQPADEAVLNALQAWADVGGSDKPADNADVTDYGDDRVANSGITLTSDGYLTFEQGGSPVSIGAVSLGGLGFIGDYDATKNTVFRGPSAPPDPTDGDIWIKTGVTPAAINVRVLGAWEVAATLNTGALADKDTVATGDIDAYSATVFSDQDVIAISFDNADGEFLVSQLVSSEADGGSVDLWVTLPSVYLDSAAGAYITIGAFTKATSGSAAVQVKNYSWWFEPYQQDKITLRIPISDGVTGAYSYGVRFRSSGGEFQIGPWNFKSMENKR